MVLTSFYGFLYRKTPKNKFRQILMPVSTSSLPQCPAFQRCCSAADARPRRAPALASTLPHYHRYCQAAAPLHAVRGPDSRAFSMLLIVDANFWSAACFAAINRSWTITGVIPMSCGDSLMAGRCSSVSRARVGGRTLASKRVH